ncbi:MAG: helix-turn-helix domain-containing protein [Pseudohongiellaceae bacterium]
MTHDANNNPLLPPLEVYSAEELQAAAWAIVNSGELGRSRVYGSLLQYLVDNVLDGKSPKEIEIALDVLGRDAAFDVSRDSVVRVNVHQLRKKLDRYYARHTPEGGYRLVIPKGQYTVAVAPLRSADPSPTAARFASPSRAQRWLRPGLLASVAVLLLLNITYMALRDNPTRSPSSTTMTAAHPLWQSVLDDDLPVLLVMGDYYIFGELNERGNVSRMIRDFNINSSADLEALFFQDTQLASKYYDLDLSYMPEGSAFALARIAPILQQANKRVDVIMMSELKTADLKSNHIVYVGYISALDKLRNVVFGDSGLRIGRTFDELVNRGTGEIYSSDAGLPSRDQPFRDYALFSTFPSTSANQVIIVAGMRDAGLMHTAQAISDSSSLATLEQRAVLDSKSAPAFEALYEVFGFDRMNFDANLVYTSELNPGIIWGGEITRLQSSFR